MPPPELAAKLRALAAACGPVRDLILDLCYWEAHIAVVEADPEADRAPAWYLSAACRTASVALLGLSTVCTRTAIELERHPRPSRAALPVVEEVAP